MSDMQAFNPNEQPSHPGDDQPEVSSEGIQTVRLTNVPPSQPQQGGWGEVAQDWKEVGDEFKQLGSRLGSAIRASFQSGNTQQQQQLTGLSDQLRAMADQVEAAIRNARQEAQAPETRAQVSRVVEKAKDARETLVDEVRDTVATALRALNAQLQEFADRLESRRK